MRKLGIVTGVLVLVCLTSSPVAKAQGLYLDNEQSGLGAAAGVSTNDDVTGLSLMAGYSFRAFIDVGLFLNRYMVEQTALDVTALGIQPYVTVHALRQDDSVPISIAGLVNYQYLFYSVDNSDVDLSGWQLFVGGSVYRRLAITDTASATPQLTLGWNHASVTTEFPGLPATTDTDEAVSFQIAGNIAFRDPGGRRWGVNPFLMIDDENVTFGLFLGVVFPGSGS